MERLFECLDAVHPRYVRTIFNFYVRHTPEVAALYPALRDRIVASTRFAEVVDDPDVAAAVKKYIYCDIGLTKHILNTACDAPGGGKPRKERRFFRVVIDEASGRGAERTRDLFLSDASSLFSYVKTIEKKPKINYGEIKRSLTNSGYRFYSGRKSDGFCSTTVSCQRDKPWIKSVRKELVVRVLDESILTRGKSSILQTIEVALKDKTCVKIFKNSTVHVILSKDDGEADVAGLVDKCFRTLRVLYGIAHAVTGDARFPRCAADAARVMAAGTLREKLAAVARHRDNYGVRNFSVGIFNLMRAAPLGCTIFPAAVRPGTKVKFFKGRKLNLVALTSPEDCARQVAEAERLLDEFARKSRVLESVAVEKLSVDEIKSILL
ncbi:ORF186 [Saltwater crocodilepox virus]|nr:intermediate transcription factor VITF-3 [Saltwater crocodilepox virus]AVD69520.1 intermediate transcription factor VITF-3 [Saltwater crocodilepox virus]QGT46623.1 ORF186 [Saltwater crocodilepox virus]QGT46840.1 ORF186 [Saltwater crocodilepox virus]QGT47055.1 ORF186 [Saltwater crocodilepox virus]